MSKAQTQVDQIRQRDIGATNKRVLLLEGDDDVKAFTQWLNNAYSGWERRWVLKAAGNKRQVLALSALADDWLALVDRDEWSDEEIQGKQTILSNLLVLPRFCLESYLVDPAELWSALPEAQRKKIPGGKETLEAALLQNMAGWERHAALWQVINPLWAGLRSLGFKDQLLRTNNIPDNPTLQARLTDWANFLSVQRIYVEVQDAIQFMQGLPQTEFLHRHLYAKNFYPEVVHPALDRWLGIQPAEQRRNDLFQTMAPPADLEPVWQRMAL